MATVKFKYAPKEGGRIVLPQYKPGDYVTAETKEQAEYLRTLDCLEEVKPEQSKSKTSAKSKSSAKSDDKEDKPQDEQSDSSS